MELKKFTSLTDEMRRFIIEDHTMITESIGFTSNCEEEVLSYYKKDNLTGWVYYENHDLLGFLVAEVTDTAQVKPYGLYADKDQCDSIIYELYKRSAKDWVLSGVKNHVFEVLNFEDYNDALMKLGFGYQQVYGLLKLDDYLPFDIEQIVNIRKLKETDSEALRKFADVIYSYQNDSPVFASAPMKTVEAIRKGFAGLINDDEVMFYIAEDQKELGYQGLWPETEGYLKPDSAVELTVAGTLKENAHKGVGKQLMNYVVKDLIEKYEWMITDWRITNISSRTFWHDKCEFEVVKNRFVRLIEADFEWGPFYE